MQHGVAHPKTMVLPNKDYIPGISHSESLRNLAYPLDWNGVAEHIGFPCVLKDAHGGGWRDVYVCSRWRNCIHHYNEQRAAHDGRAGVHQVGSVRALHGARAREGAADAVRPARAEIHPRSRLSVARNSRPHCVKDALTLCRALGYDMNTVEFAVQDGIPYAIDFMNPAPDMDIYSLTPSYFEWVVEHMADLAIKLATAPRTRVGPRPPLGSRRRDRRAALS